MLCIRTRMRILEPPDDVEQFESRDTRALTTAYVPFGSIGRGHILATSGDGQFWAAT